MNQNTSTAEPWATPASYAQERVWLASQVSRDAPVYHVIDKMCVHAGISEDQLRAGFARIVARHESLRTSFRVTDGVLEQLVHPRVEDGTPLVDLRDLDEDKQAASLEQIARDLMFEAFDLTRAPLWRMVFARTADGTWWLLFVAHHTIFDAASVLNLHAELTEVCAAAEQGREAELPELAIQYADYSAWQRGRLSGTDLDGLTAFWDARLADLPVVHGIPTDRPRPDDRAFAGADLTAALPPETVAALPDVARRFKATPFAVLLAAYVALVHRRSERDDIVVGVPVAGRDRPELLPLIGMFVNMVVLRTDASGDPTFAELVERVRDVSLAAWDHQEMPYQKLVEKYGGREPGVPPLYQLGFNLLTTPGFSTTSATAEDDLLLEVAGGQVRLEYSTSLFDAATARAVLDDYVRVLSAAVADTETRLSGLPVSTVTGGLAPAAGPRPPAEPREYVAPRTAAEELVAKTWAEVLGVERVGALDDFFDLGGHSLLALRVIGRLSAACEVELSIQAFFADTTVQGVAAELERLLAEDLDELSDDDAQRLVEEG
jgi:acyl carrier protein